MLDVAHGNRKQRREERSNEHGGMLLEMFMNRVYQDEALCLCVVLDATTRRIFVRSLTLFNLSFFSTTVAR